jgi:hypothetical protein
MKLFFLLPASAACSVYEHVLLISPLGRFLDIIMRRTIFTADHQRFSRHGPGWLLVSVFSFGHDFRVTVFSLVLHAVSHRGCYIVDTHQDESGLY